MHAWAGDDGGIHATAAGRRRGGRGGGPREDSEAGEDGRLRALRPYSDHVQASLQGHT